MRSAYGNPSRVYNPDNLCDSDVMRELYPSFMNTSIGRHLAMNLEAMRKRNC